MVKITKVRHDWPEKRGFVLNRPNGHENYIFLHFLSPVDMLINGKIETIKPGACIFFSPKEPQWFKCNENMVHNWFHADASLRETLKKLNIPENTLMYPVETKFISPLFQRAEAEFFSSDPLKDLMLEAVITEFLCIFSRTLNQPANIKVHASNHDKMRYVRQSVLSSPEKHWTVEEMARLAALSPSRFHSVYKSVFGSSPIKDSIDSRIDYIKGLLISSDMPISLIAEKAGYSDQYHFIRQFKKQTGITPAVFRKIAKNIDT